MKYVKSGMDYPYLVFRCYREINHSTSLEMLQVAMTYSLLFMKQLLRFNVNKDVVVNLEQILTKAYKRKYKTLTV